MQFEVSEFVKELQSTEQQKGKDADANPAELAQQLVVLQGQLMNLMSNDQTKAILDPSHFLRHHSLLQTDLSKKLVTEIQSATAPKVLLLLADSFIKFKKDAKEQGKDGKVTYELYYTPDQHKYVQLNRMVDLEKRVTQVEDLVGTPAAPGSGTAPPTSAPLASIVGELRDRVALLDGPRYIS